MPAKKAPRETRLAKFIRENALKPAQIAREAGYSRQFLLRVRKGIAEPTRPLMVAVRKACSRLLGREVRMSQLFNLGDRKR
jgi:hypothetical protein